MASPRAVGSLTLSASSTLAPMFAPIRPVITTSVTAAEGSAPRIPAHLHHHRHRRTHTHTHAQVFISHGSGYDDDDDDDDQGEHRTSMNRKVKRS